VTCAFQPSPYSLPPGSYQDYDGWFTNLFSKEGRAENKRKRAKRQRAKGHTKRAARLTERAGVLEAKAEGSMTLGPSSSAKKLWQEPYPFSRRKKVRGGGLTGTAKGYRPTHSQMVSEQRATILGGLMALQGAGIEGYDTVTIESLPQNMKQREGKDKKLIRAVKKTTGQSPKTLKKAAEVVRQAVTAAGLEGAAWPARGLFMLGSSAKRSGITSASTATASTVLSGIAMATTPAPPVAAALWVAAGVTALVGAGASTKQAQAKSAAMKFEEEYKAGLQQWGMRLERQAVEDEVAAAQAKLAEQEAQMKHLAAVKDERYQVATKALALTGGALFLLGMTVVVVKRKKT